METDSGLNVEGTEFVPSGKKASWVNEASFSIFNCAKAGVAKSASPASDPTTNEWHPDFINDAEMRGAFTKRQRPRLPRSVLVRKTLPEGFIRGNLNAASLAQIKMATCNFQRRATPPPRSPSLDSAASRMVISDMSAPPARLGWPRLVVVPALLATMPLATAEGVDARVLAQEGVKAHEAKDEAAFLAKMTEAAAARPDYPRILVNLAAAQVANDRADEAIATLERLAALGVHSPVEKSEDFAALRERKEFKAVVARLAANLAPKGDGEIAFSLPEMTGLIEGIAWREKTGDFFFGDVHQRAVWLRTRDNKVRRFSTEDEGLLGVFGLVVDEERGTLWAATSAVAAMHGFADDQKSTGGIAELDLESGKVRRVVLVAADGHQHALGDLTLAADGSVYATDSATPVVWRLAPGAETLDRWLESAEFESLQGLTFSEDNRTLYLTDHVNGLLRVDVASRSVRRLAAPPDTTLLGVDALARAPDGTLIVVQNGVRPMRVLRLTLDATGETIEQVKVLEAGHMTMAAPALGCVVKKEFFFIGNAGWSRFETDAPTATPPRPVPIFHTKL